MGICNSCVNKSTTPESPSFNLDEKADFLSLDGEICLAKCVKVYDGDTVTLVIHSSIGTHKWKVRTRYDSPEIKDPNLEEKAHARACRDFMKDLILNKILIIKCGGFEKYGRLLGDLYIPGKELPQNIVTQHASVKDMHNLNNLLHVGAVMTRQTPSMWYDGGKKSPFNFRLSHYHQTYQEYVENYRKKLFK